MSIIYDSLNHNGSTVIEIGGERILGAKYRKWLFQVPEIMDFELTPGNYVFMSDLGVSFLDPDKLYLDEEDMFTRNPPLIVVPNAILMLPHNLLFKRIQEDLSMSGINNTHVNEIRDAYFVATSGMAERYAEKLSERYPEMFISEEGEK